MRTILYRVCARTIQVGGLELLALVAFVSGVDALGAGLASITPFRGVLAAFGLAAFILGSFLVWRRPPAAGRGSGLLVGAAVLLICAAAPEAILRASRERAPVSPWRFDPEIGYEFAPHAQFGGTTLNGEGFRNPDRPQVKPANVYRILVLGDSMAYSLSVQTERSWAFLLEESLNARWPWRQVEVFNAGVPGYVSRQAIQRLVRRGLAFDPDCVVALIGWNDLCYSSLPAWHAAISVEQLPFAWEYKKPDTVLASRVLGLLWGRLCELRRRAESYRGLASTREDSGIPFNEEALRLYIANMDCIRETALAHGARFAAVVWPTLLTLKPYPETIDEIARAMLGSYPLSLRELADWWTRYANALVFYARNHSGVILIDPRGAFQNAPARHGLYTDIAHLSERGEAILAAHVADALALE